MAYAIPLKLSGGGLAQFALTDNLLLGTNVDDAQARLQASINASPINVAPLYGTVAHFLGVDGSLARITIDAFGNSGSLTFRSSSGTNATKTATAAGVLIGHIAGFGYDGAAYSASARAAIQFPAAELFSSTAQGAYMAFYTTPIGGVATAEVARFDDKGQFGLGVAPNTAWATSLRVIELQSGPVWWANTANGNMNIGANVYSDGANSRYKNTGYAAYINITQSGGAISLLCYPSGTAGAVLATGKSFVFDTTGSITVPNSVGMGVTVNAGWSATANVVDFYGGGTIFGLTTANIQIAANSYYDGTNWRAKATGTGGIYQLLSTGAHSWYSLASVTAGSIQTPALTLTIDASGNLTVTGTVTANSNVLGTRDLLQNSQSVAYTLVLADSGKHILHPSADTTARTYTIPANSSVAFPIGTAVTFVNQHGAGVITIAITTDAMYLAGTGTTGSRTLAANGIATALKVTATEWIISGTGLT